MKTNESIVFSFENDGDDVTTVIASQNGKILAETSVKRWHGDVFDIEKAKIYARKKIALILVFGESTGILLYKKYVLTT